jgi:hypothetical protein
VGEIPQRFWGVFPGYDQGIHHGIEAANRTSNQLLGQLKM